MKALEQARSTGKLTQGQVAGVPYTLPTGQLTRRAPLNRTHSAPLPLGPPLLNQSLLLHQQEALLAENKKLYLKQVGIWTVVNIY